MAASFARSPTAVGQVPEISEAVALTLLHLELERALQTSIYICDISAKVNTHGYM
jgi:hypothetical protein